MLDWVILLTDRRRLGEPIRLAHTAKVTTEDPLHAVRFKSELEALGWWLNLAPESPVRVHFLPTIERL